MKKNFLNIVPQEVITGGERSLRYKGSDGKYHGIQTGGGGKETLSVEEVTREVTFNFSTNNATNINVADFVMRYCSSRIAAFEVVNARYNSTSANKIYFDNSVQGPFPYYYNLSSAKVTFVGNGIDLDEIDRSTFNTNMDAAKDFFNRTIGSIIDQVSPYRIFYFMLKSNFIVGLSKVTFKEKHLIGTAKDGTRHDYGILHPEY